jgi:oxygen-independent coproporphyrinogen-3 oxidase
MKYFANRQSTADNPTMFQCPPLSLYIHIPWCVRKCPYCDFNSHRAEAGLPEYEYVSALLQDLEAQLPCVAGREVGTIFMGGGTPSLFSAEAIHTLLQGVRERLPVAPHAEITLEANPGTAESSKFQGFRQAGVNRLSIGIQSFQGGHLQTLGRIHGREEALLAAQMAREAGFDNFNLDLMFGLPQQTIDQARADVQTAIDLNPTHLSFYQLTLEPNTVFHKYPPSLPEDESIWAIQQAAQAYLAEQGFQQYEVSAYAREGWPCRHNLNYWRFGDYLGIGAGAHGKITDMQTGSVTRTTKIKHPQHYLLAAGDAGRQGLATTVPIEDLRFEFLMNALRLREGFSQSLFAERTGLPISILEPELAACLEEGLLEMNGQHIRCSAQGFNFLDTVLQRFLG